MLWYQFDIVKCRKTSVPIRKPKTPIQADTRGKIGLSNKAASFVPILWRKEITVKATKNTVERKIPIATKAGTEAEGADNKRTGAFFGSTERSK